jgi:CRISPR/Cas system-associated exonuclease Cas4 (RecB family)
MQMTKIEHLRNADPKDVRRALGFSLVIPRIEAYLEDQNLVRNYVEGPTEGSQRRLGVFSASDIGNKTGLSLCKKYPMGCARILYYRYLGVQPLEQIPPRSRRIFDTGTAIHLQLQGYLKEIAAATNGAETFADEVKVSPENNIVARNLDIESSTDGMWVINVKGEINLRFGVEIKSINDAGFKKLNGVEPYHVVQVHLYMGCLDLPIMIVLYYNKNDSTMVEYPIKFSSEVWDAIVAKIYYVRERAVEEKPPEREAGYHCRTCRYAHVCEPPKRFDRRQVRVGRRRFTTTGE